MTRCSVNAAGALAIVLALSALPSRAYGDDAGFRSDPSLNAVLARGVPGFVVQRDGAVVGFFTEVSGIGSETEIIEHREGGDPGVVHKVPGRTTYPDITLKRGITSNLDLWDWRQEVVDGLVSRSRVIVTLVGRQGRARAQWVFENAWPSKISGPQLQSDSNDIAIETLTIAHEGLTRTQ